MDLSQKILSQLLARKFSKLALADEFVLPDYGGGSIANLPSQVAQWLAVRPFGVAPLHDHYAAHFGEGVQRVILVLMDAMGYERFQNMIRETGSVWHRLSEAGVFAPLTSVFPSTTSAALTSVWSGHAPGEHGMLGYEMWLKEYGATANMINFSPMSISNYESELLLAAGFDPEKYLTMPTLGAHLAAQEVETHAFMPAHLMRSGLSKMHLHAAQPHGYQSVTELWSNLREFLNNAPLPNKKQFIWVYFPTVDSLSHVYGPAHEMIESEARNFGNILQTQFMERLTPSARRATVLAVVADHGQVDTPRVRDYELQLHPEFLNMLHILPSGENRAMYLHCRPDKVAEARAYLEKHWGDQFCIVSQAEALAAGLYGTNIDVKTAGRLGEWLVLSKGQAYFWWATKENKMLGRHGGLGRAEMLVPLVAGRLDRW